MVRHRFPIENQRWVSWVESGARSIRTKFSGLVIEWSRSVSIFFIFFFYWNCGRNLSLFGWKVWTWELMEKPPKVRQVQKPRSWTLSVTSNSWLDLAKLHEFTRPAMISQRTETHQIGNTCLTQKGLNCRIYSATWPFYRQLLSKLQTLIVPINAPLPPVVLQFYSMLIAIRCSVILVKYPSNMGEQSRPLREGYSGSSQDCWKRMWEERKSFSFCACKNGLTFEVLQSGGGPISALIPIPSGHSAHLSYCYSVSPLHQMLSWTSRLALLYLAAMMPKSKPVCGWIGRKLSWREG